MRIKRRKILLHLKILLSYSMDDPLEFYRVSYARVDSFRSLFSSIKCVFHTSSSIYVAVYKLYVAETLMKHHTNVSNGAVISMGQLI